MRRVGSAGRGKRGMLRGGEGRGRGEDKERLIKLRVPRDVAFTRPNLPQKHICSAKVPTDS